MGKSSVSMGHFLIKFSHGFDISFVGMASYHGGIRISPRGDSTHVFDQT